MLIVVGAGAGGCPDCDLGRPAVRCQRMLASLWVPGLEMAVGVPADSQTANCWLEGDHGDAGQGPPARLGAQLTGPVSGPEAGDRS